MKLTEAQVQHLHDLALCSDRPQPETAALVKHGLAQQGKGRFGEWVRLTEKGIALFRSKPLEERIRREGMTISRTLAEPDRITPAAPSPRSRREILGESASPERRTAETQVGLSNHRQSIPSGAAESGGDLSKPSVSRSKRIAPSPAPLHPPGDSATVTRAKQAAPKLRDERAGSLPRANVKESSGARIRPTAAPTAGNEHQPSRKPPRPAAKSAAISRHNDTGHTQPNAYRMLFGRKYVYYSLKDGAKLSGSKDRVRTECRLNRPTPVGSPESDKDVLC